MAIGAVRRGLERSPARGDGRGALMVTVRIFLKLTPNTRIGQGKVDLLEAVEATGSISAASRRLQMSFRRAWALLDHMSKAFGRPVVTGHVGSAGGAELTDLGREIVRRFRRIESETKALAAPHLAALEAVHAPEPEVAE
jgi:molybdate transport system regulatory protein